MNAPMQFRPLGQTGLKVSVVGLGTMTWGEQNTEKEAHEQLDFAFAQGVNLIDVAEMYPVPPKAETLSPRAGFRSTIQSVTPTKTPTNIGHVTSGCRTLTAGRLAVGVFMGEG